MDDREVVAAIAAEDPAGIAAAYDRYAAALYSYCYWMLRRPADAAEALRDTFVIVATAPGDLPEARELRSWLYSVARKECLHRSRAEQAGGDAEADAGQTYAAIDRRIDVTQLTRAAYERADATVPFRAVDRPTDTTHEPADATMFFRAVNQPADTTHEPADATMPFRAVNQPADTTDEPADVTMLIRAVNQPTDTMVGRAAGHSDAVEAELRTMVRTVLTGLKPREREAIELQLGHDLYDADLAIALGVSYSRAHVLASQARSELEIALGALLAARSGREDCPTLDELLTDWDGQLTDSTREMVSAHIEQCENCASHQRGTMYPAALRGLFPQTPLPAELRDPVLRASSSTAPDSLAHRQRVVRRVKFMRLTQFFQAIRQVRWRSIRGRSRPATATMVFAGWVVAVWVVALVLFIFAGSHPDRALAARPSVSAHAIGPTAVPSTAAASPKAVPASATVRPSPSISQAPVVVAPPAEASASPTHSSSPKPSKSASPKPSTSASPKPSTSSTPSPRPSSSASPSPTG